MIGISGEKLKLYQERILFGRNPITAQISISTACNLNCFYCFHRNDIDGGEFMKYRDFDKVLYKLAVFGVKGVVFSGQGEPSLHPQFGGMLSRLHDRGIKYGINSNMLKYFDPKYAAWLKVNLDAASAAEYKKIKGVDGYDRVIENVCRVRKKRPLVRIGLQCLVTEPGAASRFYYAHKKALVDYMSFKPIETLEGGFYSENNLELIKAELKGLKNKGRVSVSYKWDHIGNRYKKCHANFAIISIRHDLQVAYCCSIWRQGIGSVLDYQILKTKSCHKQDMTQCPTPCRLSGLNDYVRDYERPIDAEFC